VTTRRLSSTSHRELQDLLQGILVTELLAPGGRLWLLSPQLQDAQILDNRGGAFSAINPSWGHRWVRLSEVLIELLQHGLQQLRITVLDSDGNSQQFQHRLVHLARQLGKQEKVHFEQTPTLPSAGLLCDTGYLSGHIILLEQGPALESVEATWHTLPEDIQAGRAALEARYGV
jgi:hypothetical protein